MRIQTSFRGFHERNPIVYQTLINLAREARAKGHRKLGISMLWERMRWEMTVTTYNDSFKLNNNYRSRYARLIMQQEPDLADFFDIRELGQE